MPYVYCSDPDAVVVIGAWNANTRAVEVKLIEPAWTNPLFRCELEGSYSAEVILPVVYVPEPSLGLLAGVAALGVLARRMRRRRARPRRYQRL